MAVTTPNIWTDSYAVSAAFQVPNPTQQTRQVTVANTAGNWLVAFVAWRTSAGAQTVPSVSVGDDAHNWWVPLGRVSTATGGCAIWAAPNARAAKRVYVAPTGYITSADIEVVEYAGMGLYLSTPAVNSNIAVGTSVSASLGVPSAQALALTVGLSDSVAATLSSATAGWTSLTAMSAGNGVDTSGDLRMLPRWQTTTGSTSVTYTTSASATIAALEVTVLVSAAAPAQTNLNWPITKLEAGFGSGASTPLDSITWTDITKRFMSVTTARGRNYELGALEAGEAEWTLRNNDGALNPANASSPYYPYVTDGTPLRLTAAWAGRVYGVCWHTAEAWPQTWRNPHWGEVNATSVDAWASMTAELPNVVAGEILVDVPHAYWPLTDPAESTTASNLAAGNAEPLVETLSKYGAGSGVADFGADSGALTGAPSNTAWSQTGLTSLQTTNGTTLKYGPGPALPGVSGGWTVECWAKLLDTGQPTSNLTIFVCRNGNGSVISVYVDQATGFIAVADYDPTTHARVNTVSSTPGITGDYEHYCLVFDVTGWRLYINAQQILTRTTPLDSAITWVSFNGQADELFHGRMFNGSLAHCAIFPRVLPYGRIVAHYWAAQGGMADDAVDWRVNRLLAMAAWGGPRSLSYTTDNLVPATDIQGAPLAACVAAAAGSAMDALYIDGLGYLCHTAKTYRYNRASQYTLGDRPDLGEIPYDGGIEFGWDPQQVKNKITATQAHYGRQAVASDATSIAQRRIRTGDVETHVSGGVNTVADAANYQLLRQKQPGLRVQQITLDPASNPSIWPTALAAEVDDIVTVNRRPVGGVLLTGRFQVISIRHQINFEAGQWRVTLALIPADPFVFILDDPVYGILDGPGVLGW